MTTAVYTPMPTGRKRRDPASSDLGLALFRARTARNLTQLQVGARAGLSESSISQLENGKIRASPETLRELARALELDYDELARLAGYQSRRVGDEPVYVTPDMAADVRWFARLPRPLQRVLKRAGDAWLEEQDRDEEAEDGARGA